MVSDLARLFMPLFQFFFIRWATFPYMRSCVSVLRFSFSTIHAFPVSDFAVFHFYTFVTLIFVVAIDFVVVVSYDKGMHILCALCASSIIQSHNPLGSSVCYFTEYHFDIRYLNYASENKIHKMLKKSDARNKYWKPERKREREIEYSLVPKVQFEKIKRTKRRMWYVNISLQQKVSSVQAWRVYNNIHLLFPLSASLIFSPYLFFFCSSFILLTLFAIVYFFFNKEVVQRLRRQHRKQTEEEKRQKQKLWAR